MIKVVAAEFWGGWVGGWGGGWVGRGGAYVQVQRCGPSGQVKCGDKLRVQNDRDMSPG